MKYFITFCESLYSTNTVKAEDSLYPQYIHEFIPPAFINKVATAEHLMVKALLAKYKDEITDTNEESLKGFILASGNTKWAGSSPGHVNNLESIKPFSIPALAMTNIYCGRLANSLGYSDMISTDSTACISGHKSIYDAVLYMKEEGLDKVAILSVENGCSVEHLDFFGKAHITIPATKYEEGIRHTLAEGTSNGFLLGQGVNITIIESEASLGKSGRLPLAEIKASAVQAETIADPMKQLDSGIGYAKVIASLLKKSRVHKDEISYVKLHGTGTESNTRSESKAVAGLPNVKSFGYKHLTGHCLGTSCNIDISILLKDTSLKNKNVICLSAGMGNVFAGVLLEPLGV